MNALFTFSTMAFGGYVSSMIEKSDPKTPFAGYNATSAKDIIRSAFESAAAGDDTAAAFIQKLQIEAKAQETIATFQQQAKVNAVDWNSEKTKYLADRMLKSKHTVRAYQQAFDSFEGFCKANEITPFQSISRAQCKDWIRSLQVAQKSSATIRLYVAAVKGFFSEMQDSYEDSINNPLRGIKLPSKKLVRACIYPSVDEAKLIIEYIAKHEKTGILAKMAALSLYDGFRVGAYQTAEITYQYIFETTSKGKKVRKQLSKESIKALQGLKGEGVFSKWNAAKAERLFNFHVAQMRKSDEYKDVIRANYSFHDLRHTFAKSYYDLTKDIRAVQIALNHSEYATTEIYLRDELKVLPPKS